ACLLLSPFINGGNGQRAIACPSLSPFINGGNGVHATACLLVSPFMNGGNGQRVRSCRTVAADWQEVGRGAGACHRHLTGLTVRTGGCRRITSRAGAVTGWRPGSRAAPDGSRPSRSAWRGILPSAEYGERAARTRPPGPGRPPLRRSGSLAGPFSAA